MNEKIKIILDKIKSNPILTIIGLIIIYGYFKFKKKNEYLKRKNSQLAKKSNKLTYKKPSWMR